MIRVLVITFGDVSDKKSLNASFGEVKVKAIGV